MKLLITTLLLPLGLVLAMLVTAGAVLWRNRYNRTVPQAAFIWLFAGIAALAVFSMPVVGRSLGLMLVSQVQGRAPMMPDAADVIVVLTGNMFNAGPIGWLPTAASVQRLAVAYELQGILGSRVPVIISGGHTAGVKNPSEARVLADFFARGSSQILPTELEESSTDTYENAMQLASILSKRQVRNVFLVTSDTHMLRALATFRARGIDPVPFPAMSLPAGQGVEDFLPSVAGLAQSTAVVYEMYGLVSYLVSGKISLADTFYTPQPNESE